MFHNSPQFLRIFLCRNDQIRLRCLKRRIYPLRIRFHIDVMVRKRHQFNTRWGTSHEGTHKSVWIPNATNRKQPFSFEYRYILAFSAILTAQGIEIPWLMNTLQNQCVGC